MPTPPFGQGGPKEVNFESCAKFSIDCGIFMWYQWGIHRVSMANEWDINGMLMGYVGMIMGYTHDQLRFRSLGKSSKRGVDCCIFRCHVWLPEGKLSSTGGQVNHFYPSWWVSNHHWSMVVGMMYWDRLNLIKGLQSCWQPAQLRIQTALRLPVKRPTFIDQKSAQWCLLMLYIYIYTINTFWTSP